VLDMAFEKNVQTAIRRIVREGLVESAHDLSDGGLAVALAECGFPNGVGAQIELDSDLRPEFLLFGEAPSRILVSTEHAERIQSIGDEYSIPVLRIGFTVAGRLEVRNRNVTLIQSDLSNLRQLWADALEQKLESRR
jgi:phosphoribosylformylglycinamidine synthase